MSNPVGAPTIYNTEIAKAICDQIATNKCGLRKICAQPGMPSLATIFRWLHSYPEFREQYTHARMSQTETFYDDLLEIGDAPLVDDDGNALQGPLAMAEVQRRRVQTDNLKFILAKLQPKRFGDNMNVNMDVKVNHKLSDEQFANLLKTAAAAPQIEQPYEDAQIVEDEINGEDLLK